MTPIPEHNAKIAKLTFAAVYPLYLAKVERKGRIEEELQRLKPFLNAPTCIRMRTSSQGSSAATE